MSMRADLVILGGGPAGLAVAYYAQKNNLDFLLLEAGEETGGNCRTIWEGEFGFDTGAHRFHDKDPDVTKEIKELLGEDLRLVEAPSSIFYKNTYVDFPLSPLDLLRKIGSEKFLLAAWQILKASFKQKHTHSDFESFALNTYGKFIAQNFLINYSEKLWGLPARQLSKKISGKRLKGLNIQTFLIEGLSGRYAKTRHLDGSFYYPLKGFGEIMQKMEERLPIDKILKQSKVSAINTTDKGISDVIINGKVRIEGKNFVNTLSLPLTLKLLKTSVPKDVSDLAERLLYRHLMLAVFFIDKAHFSLNASLYFPEKDIPFTRIYEPKNRSSFLAPLNQTCIVIEIPCQQEDDWWNLDDDTFKIRIMDILIQKNLIKGKDIIGFRKLKVPFAYPILEKGFENNLQKVRDFMSQFENLYLSGRSGLFTYSHLHDQLNWGKEIVEKIIGKVGYRT